MRSFLDLFLIYHVCSSAVVIGAHHLSWWKQRFCSYYFLTKNNCYQFPQRRLDRLHWLLVAERKYYFVFSMWHSLFNQLIDIFTRSLKIVTFSTYKEFTKWFSIGQDDPNLYNHDTTPVRYLSLITNWNGGINIRDVKYPECARKDLVNLRSLDLQQNASRNMKLIFVSMHLIFTLLYEFQLTTSVNLF